MLAMPALTLAAAGYIVPSPGITFKGSLTICYGVKAIADDDRAFASGDKTMFIAMNRFRVKRGAEDAFEKVWLSRDSYLERVPGFVEFHLLKGPEAEDHTLYASHTVWQSKAAFEAWTKSEEFRAAHARAGNDTTGPLYLEHPKFEGFEVRQIVTHKAAVA
jgi:heme-degrading monooxygenase HmoA